MADSSYWLQTQTVLTYICLKNRNLIDDIVGSHDHCTKSKPLNAVLMMTFLKGVIFENGLITHCDNFFFSFTDLFPFLSRRLAQSKSEAPGN